ncbi:MAG: serine dehydratase, partial [Clostridia bacterium]|nr:serine dehydratase [Clostridia bacterium]
MKSIRDIYKIGKGPSSSHTMGPERAAKLYRAEHPDATGYRVELYGSLSKTGIGHGTDRVLYDTLSPVPTEVIFCKEELPDSHPNTMIFYCVENGQAVNPLTVESIGGGDIRIPGRSR